MAPTPHALKIYHQSYILGEMFDELCTAYRLQLGHSQIFTPVLFILPNTEIHS